MNKEEIKNAIKSKLKMRYVWYKGVSMQIADFVVSKDGHSDRYTLIFHDGTTAHLKRSAMTRLLAGYIVETEEKYTMQRAYLN